VHRSIKRDATRHTRSLYRSYAAKLLPLSKFYAGAPISPVAMELSRWRWVMGTIAQKRAAGFYRLLSNKGVRLAVLLCSLVLVSAAINALIIVLGSKGP
jgi:hypothetical protein